MLRSFFVLIPLLSLSLSLRAQDDRQRASAYQEAQSALLQARKQQRRDVLRETLKAQEQDVPVPVRQLSPLEKAQLREQLRQQRQDSPK